MEQHDDQDSTQLARVLGLREAVSIAIGTMIGGGIFTALGSVVLYAGPFAVLSFLIGGVIAFLTAHSYIKLVAKYPSAGGEFVILRKGYKTPIVGDFIGIMLFIGYCVTISLYAITFGAYTSEWLYQLTKLELFNPNLSSIVNFRTIMTVFIILFFMAINLVGVKEAGSIQNIIIVLKFGALIILTIIGASFLKLENFIASMESVEHQLEGGGMFLSFLFGTFIGASIIFVDNEGFQVIINTIEEMKKPTRDVRIGMYISITIVCVAYVSISFVTIGLISGEISETALIQAISFLGPMAITLIAFGAIGSSTSAINSTLLGSSRLAYIMAEWKTLPKRFSTISKKTKVPYVTVIIATVLSLLFLLLGNPRTVAEVASIIFLIVFLIINLSVLKVYKEEKNIVSKLAFMLILVILLLSLYNSFFLGEGEAGEIMAFLLLFAFSGVTLLWILINRKILHNITSEEQIPELKPLGADDLEEFVYKDPSDIFFTKLENVLVPIANKPYEAKNLQIVAYLSRKYGVKLTLLHLIEEKPLSFPRMKNETQYLEKIKDFMDTHEVNYEIHVKKIGHNNIAKEIIQEYNSGNYQLISMASRRKTNLIDQLFEKHISKEVVNHVQCAVLQVFPPKYQAGEAEIGNIFTLLDGTERDAFIMRWAHLIASGKKPTRVTAYHTMELPRLFPLDEAPKIPCVRRSERTFIKYVKQLSIQYSMKITPKFMLGTSFVQTVASEAEKHEPDAILIGYSQARGWKQRFLLRKSRQIVKEVSGAVIVHHIPKGFDVTKQTYC